VFVILTSKPGHYRTEAGADFRCVEAYDYEFCGRVRARFVIAELLRASRMRIVDEGEVPTVNDVPTKFLQKYPSAETARDELKGMSCFGSVDIRLVPRPLAAAPVHCEDRRPERASITFESGDGRTVEVPIESNLLRVSLRESGGIPYKCGAGLCGTCRCRLVGAPGALDEVKAKERKHLSEAELASGWRMACQTFVRGDVRVHW
jgi:ferredoxin